MCGIRCYIGRTTHSAKRTQTVDDTHNENGGGLHSPRHSMSASAVPPLVTLFGIALLLLLLAGVRDALVR